MNKKMIPCRVCGKNFEPCAYCQEYNEVFRWRNFACSKECAVKYINEATAYRDSLKTKRRNDENEKLEHEKEILTVDTKTKRKSKIKEESEQIE